MQAPPTAAHERHRKDLYVHTPLVNSFLLGMTKLTAVIRTPLTKPSNEKFTRASLVAQKKSLQGIISYLGIITDATPARRGCKQELEGPEKHCLDPTRIRNSDSAAMDLIRQIAPNKKDNVLENARVLRAQINTRMSEITDILKSDPLCIPVTFQPDFQIARKK
jgi:hypothetical protein